jgi:hypothetical protein
LNCEGTWEGFLGGKAKNISLALLCSDLTIGESTAKKIEVRGQIFAGSNFAIDVQRPVVKTFAEVLSGQKLRAEIRSEIPMVDAAMGKRTGIDYYCLGWVAYWDGNGLRRETGFCFRVDLWSGGREEWVNAEKQQYEYEY